MIPSSLLCHLNYSDIGLSSFFSIDSFLNSLWAWVCTEEFYDKIKKEFKSCNSAVFPHFNKNI